MHLVEIFLPLSDNSGTPFAAGLYEAVRQELTEHFGGVTSFSRSPADGRFQENGKVVRDDIVVFEVMIESLDRSWWGAYRRSLERIFSQDEILIRATAITRL